MKRRILKRWISIALSIIIVTGIAAISTFAEERIAVQNTIRFSYDDPLDKPPIGTPGKWHRCDTSQIVYPYGGFGNTDHPGTVPDSSYALTTEMREMQSGRAIISRIIGNMNMFQTFTQEADTLNLTGQQNNVYHISWNQYLSEKEEGHTASTIYRGPQIRLSTQNTYDDTLFAGFFSTEKSVNREFYPAISYQSTVKASGTQPLQKGKWYHCDFYMYANCTSSAAAAKSVGQDSFILTCYEYGGDGSDMQTVVLDNSGGSQFREGYRNIGLYEYTIPEADDENFHGFADLSITKYPIAISHEVCGNENLAAVSKINALKTAVDNFKPVFGGIVAAATVMAPRAFEVMKAGDIPMTAPFGTTLTWSSNNTEIISFDSGMPVVHAPAEDTRLCLTAKLTDDNGYSIEKSFPVMVAAQSAIRRGEYLQMGQYNDDPILWRCIANDKNGALMIADRILCVKEFDTFDANSNGEHFGSNCWADSSIREWLNSSSGFYGAFNQAEKRMIKTMRSKSVVSADDKNLASQGNEIFSYEINNNTLQSAPWNYDNSYAMVTEDKISLPDVKQIYNIYNNSMVLGDYYNAYPTAGCISESEYSDELFNEQNRWHYWLKTPVGNDASNMLTVLGNVYNFPAATKGIGVRPVCYVDSERVNFIEGNGEKGSPFIIGDIGTGINEVIYHDGVLSVDISVRETSDSAAEFIGIYDNCGRLLTCHTITPDTASYDFARNIPVNLSAGKYKAKLMLWKENMSPVTSVQEEAFVVE